MHAALLGVDDQGSAIPQGPLRRTMSQSHGGSGCVGMHYDRAIKQVRGVCYGNIGRSAMLFLSKLCWQKLILNVL